MDFGTIAAKMTLDISNFTNQLDLAQSQAQKLAQESSKAFNVGSSLTQMGKTLTVGVTLPIMGLATAAVKVGNEFQYQMSRVQAISGATSKQLQAMEQQAIKLGASTAFSAKETAQGMENLASAGFNVNEIMSAIPGTLDLAAVSGGDVAASAEAMASSLRAFGLDASKAGHVANVFAKAAADTNAETVDMAEAMKYVAPVAHAMGLSIEETAASIGIMSDAGIKGSQAGTTLRGALSRIAKPTKAMHRSMEALGVSFYDAQGKMIPLKEQIGQLKQATAGLTQEERNRHLVTLYGQQSLSGMLALLDAGPEKLDKMTNSFINSTGAAEEMAKTMQNNLSSEIEQMFGAMESAGIIIQKILEPMLTKVVSAITRMVEAFVNMSPLGQKMVVIFAGMAAALGPLLLIVGTVITTIVKLKIAIAFLGPAFMGTMGTIGLVIAGIFALVAGFMIAYTKSETFRNFVNKLASALKESLGVALEWTGEKLKIFWQWLKEVSSSLKEVGSSVGGKIASGLKAIGESFGVTGNSIGEFISSGLERLGGAFGKVGGVVALAVPIITKIGLALAGISGPIGMIISLVVSLVSAWVRTGELNADGLTQVFENLSSTISNVAEMISSQLPVFIEKGAEILTNIIQGISSNIPKIVSTISQVISSLTSTLTSVLPQIIEAGIQILTSLITGITQALPMVIETAITLITSLLNTIVEMIPQLIDAGLQIINALISALVEALPTIIDAGIQILMALIQGIISMLPAIIEAVIQIIMALVQALIENLPTIIDAGIQLLMALIQGIITILPQLIEAAIQIIMALVQALIQNLPQIIQAGVQLLMALIKGLVQVIPQLISAAFQIIGSLIMAILQNLPQILSAGVQLLGALIQGIFSLLGQLLSTIGSMMTQMLAAIGRFVAQMVATGVELIANFVSGLGQKIADVVSKAGDIGRAVVEGVKAFAGDLVDAGANLVRGFIDGMGSMVNGVVDKAVSLGKAAVDNIKSFLGIHSPSKVLFRIGNWTGQGLVDGLAGMVGAVGNQANRIAETVTDSMNGVSMSISSSSLLDSISNAYREVKRIGSQLSMPQLELAGLGHVPDADYLLNRNYNKGTDSQSTSKTVYEGDVNIGTIVVRNDTDLDEISKALHDRNYETLEQLGDREE